MKERPILFSAPMVRATLDDAKTHTRRAFSARLCQMMIDAASIGEVSDFLQSGKLAPGDSKYIKQFCPYGTPGDRLWAKETFGYGPSAPALRDHVLHYRADETDGRLVRKWSPSIFMLRALSRITLEIADIRVERLDDISEADALAEGIVRNEFPMTGSRNGQTARRMKSLQSPTTIRRTVRGIPTSAPTAAMAYKRLWESINGPGSWDLNPWVWVIVFRRIKP